MRIHPRRRPVTRAKSEMERLLLDLIVREELTIAETAYVLADLSRTFAALAVRDEREEDNE